MEAKNAMEVALLLMADYEKNFVSLVRAQTQRMIEKGVLQQQYTNLDRAFCNYLKEAEKLGFTMNAETQLPLHHSFNELLFIVNKKYFKKNIGGQVLSPHFDCRMALYPHNDMGDVYLHKVGADNLPTLLEQWPSPLKINTTYKGFIYNCVDGMNSRREDVGLVTLHSNDQRLVYISYGISRESEWGGDESIFNFNVVSGIGLPKQSAGLWQGARYENIISYQF
ncbi:MAG: hypothetical protein KA998_02835 [Rickettsiaceae bacterium]|nr:hypothetical protein [Rickettsiaceae bacterium]